jgi:thymidylate synthase (FAD)
LQAKNDKEDKIQVLDKGFVELIDFMGGDSRIADAARVSMKGDQKERSEAEDVKLIEFMIKNHHGTPFEKSIFEFHVKCPIFVARQTMRHRIGTFVEASGRYTEFEENDFYIPEEAIVYDKEKKQNIVYKEKNIKRPYDEKYKHEVVRAQIRYTSKQSFRAYQHLLRSGIAKEQARIILPVNFYTRFYWTINSRSLMNFVKLRSSKHAQKEQNSYVFAICHFFESKLPLTYKFFKKYELT